METQNNMHLKKFLRACLSAHSSADNKSYVTSREFSAMAKVPACQWTKQTSGRLFPTLTAASPSPSTGGTNTTLDIASLVVAITAATRPVLPANTHPTPSETDDKTIAKGKLTMMLLMCGKASMGTIHDFPG
mmetsp:Transcript_38073/g.88586  ORF Transcript_38073/g.88586 Transcript_38073/m.88586 type:complete len:132 (-) Transcript_38073:2310-2705(-)